LAALLFLAGREALDWLQSLADGQPCPPEEITFEIRQSGDTWDGYSEAEVMVYREETPAEAAEREAKWAQERAAREAGRAAQELATLAALKAKYES
jgi:hypothetical protein